MSLDIVPIREDLIEGFHAALDIVARERRYLSLLEAAPIEAVRQFVRRNIANGYPQFVALADGRVVGWCDVTPSSRPSEQHCGVLGMGLLPAWRGRGLGTRLLQRTLEAARAFGLFRVELRVRADNGAALALYRHAGFETEGRLRRAVLIDGAHHDLIVMAFLFDAAA